MCDHFFLIIKQPHIKGAISLVIVYDEFIIPQGFVWVSILNFSIDFLFEFFPSGATLYLKKLATSLDLSKMSILMTSKGSAVWNSSDLGDFFSLLWRNNT